EHDNFRAALGWSVENGEAAATLRLAGALTRLWDVRRHISEGREWLARALALDAGEERFDRDSGQRRGAARGGERAALRARALFGAGVSAHRQDAIRGAHRFWAESLAIRRGLGDGRGIAEVINASVELAKIGKILRRGRSWRRA